jgi:hypothetical protein
MRARRVVRRVAVVAAVVALLLAQPSIPGASAARRLSLRFAAQPQDAKVGETVTSVAFTPTAAPPAVEIVDGNRRANIRTAIEWSVPGIVATTTVEMDGGLAALAGIVGSAPGQGFTVVVAAPEYGLTAVSAPFDVYEEVTPCATAPSGKCVVNHGNADHTFDVAVEAESVTGFLALNVSTVLPATPTECAAEGNQLPALTVQDESNINAPKVATMEIDHTIVDDTAENGAAHYAVCYSKTGTSYFPLDACRRRSPGPCILSQTKSQLGDVVIKLLLPAGDPFWF